MEPIQSVAAVYGSVALLTALSAIAYSLRSRPRRRERLDGAERALLLLTGALAGALWLLLAPVFVTGWWRTQAPRFAARLRRPRRALAGRGGALLPPASGLR